VAAAVVMKKAAARTQMALQNTAIHRKPLMEMMSNGQLAKQFRSGLTERFERITCVNERLFKGFGFGDELRIKW
jgi:hypothetical protein